MCEIYIAIINLFYFYQSCVRLLSFLSLAFWKTAGELRHYSDNSVAEIYEEKEEERERE